MSEETPEVVKRGPGRPPAASRVKADNEVTVRITKKGDGLVHTGEGEATFASGDKPSLDREVAEALEDRGFVEIED